MWFMKQARARRGMASVFSAGMTLALLSGVTLTTIAGCGGGSSSNNTNPSATTPVNFGINWAARSRAVSGPASALSAVAVLRGGALNGSDLSLTTAPINRDGANTAAYSQNITSASPAKVGEATLVVTFFAEANGNGAVVGVAQAPVTITATGGGIGDIAAVGRVAAVEVGGGQSVSVDLQKDLTFTAKDASGAILAVSPGSAQFAVTGGADKLQLAASGAAKGLIAGTVKRRPRKMSPFRFWAAVFCKA